MARFSTLVEAQVACSALRAAGFHAEALEQGMVSLFWSYQTALGGVRVAVPESELADATAYLAEIGRTRPRAHRRPRDKGVIWRFLALIAGFGLTPYAGWLVIGVRDRAAKGSALSLWGAFVVVFLMTLALAVTLALLGAFIFADRGRVMTY